MDVVLTITLNPTTGQISVNGPIDNKLMCYGLLEAARDVVATYAVPSRIVPIHASLPTNGKDAS